MSAASPDRRRVMFVYWGRRGALTRLAHEVQRTALADPTISPSLSVSRQNEAFESHLEFGDTLFPVNTFASGAGALTGVWRIPGLGRSLRARLERDRIQAVINLMPHLWTPSMIGHAHHAGARFATIVHDAVPHPGDRTAWALPRLLTEADRADAVVTLSDAVRRQLVASGHAKGRPVIQLFHPDMSYGTRAPREPNGPLRLLWFGRIMPYKGLGLFVDAMELLRQQGTAIEIGVFGDGSVEPYEARLRALHAEIENRWIADDEIAGIMSRFDAIALSHIEASQSGVAATAFGAGLPVIATPVGGLPEQVKDTVNGLVAEGTSPSDFAEAVRRLATDRALYAKLRANLADRSDHSMARFVRRLVDAVLPT